jgi:hypothetical protein
MEVTKCDRCGKYIDKPESEMPVIIYRFRDSDKYLIDNNTEKRHLCFVCYDEFFNWIEPLKKEEKNADND